MPEGCRFLESYSDGCCGDRVDGETAAGVPMCETHLALVDDVGPIIERDSDGAPVVDHEEVTA
jgi:hypothetical protein